MNQFNSWIAALQQLVSNIDKFTVETNENISAWNELFKAQKVDIPLIDSSNTVKYIKDNLILIGMPGAGKSTIGIVLAKIIGYTFIDSDIK